MKHVYFLSKSRYYYISIWMPPAKYFPNYCRGFTACAADPDFIALNCIAFWIACIVLNCIAFNCIAWANLWPIWGQLVRNWGQLGTTWAQLGPTWANLGPIWANLGQHSANLGPTWHNLGPTGASLCLIWPLLYST